MVSACVFETEWFEDVLVDVFINLILEIASITDPSQSVLHP